MESITIPVANQEDAEDLKNFAIEAFTRNFKLYGCYPPGIDSLKWHKGQIENGHCHKIFYGKELVGGIYLLPHPDRSMKLDFFFIGTQFQGKKIGSQVLELIEAAYPDVKKWFLSAPYKDYGNHHFYEKHCFIKVGEFKPDENADFILFQYEKQL